MDNELSKKKRLEISGVNPWKNKDTDGLFELCKEVYEKTGLNKGQDFYTNGLQWWCNTRKEGWHLSTYGHGLNNDAFPLYTSDYLLEKLPANIELYKYAKRYEATKYANPGDSCIVRADTPLKALLKLTIALHEAGELK